jgi:ribonucleoside-diphosphate reductase beta chain
MNMTVFNQDNDEWKAGIYSLFLGQAPGLYDSINVTHPKIFKLYKDQKSADWSEDEVDLEQSRIDMLTCPAESRELMLENLALQWEADSIAARSIAPLFAPFVTNSEYWAALLKVSEIEVLHALTYSEIVRVCMDNPKEIFERIMKNDAIISRMNVIAKAFNELRIAGAKYVLGMITEQQAYPVVMNAVVALYCLERLQFVDSFAATFGVVETGVFQGIGKLVQKIMQDERYIHAELGKRVITVELATEHGQNWFRENSTTVREMIDEVVRSEYEWNDHLHSNGRKVIGFSHQGGVDWIDYNAQEVYEVFGFEPPRKIEKNPLKYMENWLDLNKTQNANQEGDQANYRLNIIIDDLGDKIIEWSYR